MYEVIKTVIDSRMYELTDMLKKIDVFWAQGNLSDEKREELVKLARDNADASNSVDVLRKLEELDRRVSELERSMEEPTDEYPEYVPGKWYYKDDKVTFNGKCYICIAPEGQVCTWSPDEYPAYWKADE